jgi:hypothetical protein
VQYSNLYRRIMCKGEASPIELPESSLTDLFCFNRNETHWRFLQFQSSRLISKQSAFWAAVRHAMEHAPKISIIAATVMYCTVPIGIVSFYNSWGYKVRPAASWGFFARSFDNMQGSSACTLVLQALAARLDNVRRRPPCSSETP